MLTVIGAGGALGAAARYGTALAIPPGSGAFPFATFAVNVVGAVILGVLAVLPDNWLPAHDLAKPGIGTGFCGGFTTFSTMTLELYKLTPGHPQLAAGYAAASVLAAPLCALAGAAIGRRLQAAGPNRPGRPQEESDP